MSTISQASRYQQLRDHLNYLRLAHAAAALPAVLVTAKTQNLSVTAALEKLLRIEGDARPRGISQISRNVRRTRPRADKVTMSTAPIRRTNLRSLTDLMSSQRA